MIVGPWAPFLELIILGNELRFALEFLLLWDRAPGGLGAAVRTVLLVPAVH